MRLLAGRALKKGQSFGGNTIFNLLACPKACLPVAGGSHSPAKLDVELDAVLQFFRIKGFDHIIDSANL